MAEVAQTFIDNSANRELQALLRQQRMAEILQSQAFQPEQRFSYGGIDAPPSAAGAIAKALQGGIGAYLQGRSLKGQEDLSKKTEERENKYGVDLARALAGATPGRSFDTASVGEDFMPRVGAESKGGLEGISAALQRVNNPDVTRSLGPQITMAQIAQQQAAADRAAKLADAKELKVAPGWEKPPTPVPGRDVPLAPEVFNQQVAIAGARADASRETPEQAAARANAVTTATNQANAAIVKPVPVPVMKLERDDRDALNTTQTINDNLSRYIDQIDSGKLDFGMIANKKSEAANALGMSTEQSRNYASFMAGLEKLRNDSLRLNVGVQTDGDAKRAWDELVKNINDPKVVRQRLVEIMAINDRGAALKADNLEQLYAQYPQLRPKDKGEGPTAEAKPKELSAEDKMALDWANANPKDPRAAAIKQRLGM